MIKNILLFLMIVAISCNIYATGTAGVQGERRIEPGLYILVSFSMNDKSLRRYFVEAESMGGRLVINGLVADKNGNNRFEETKARIDRAKINVDINPVIFEELGVKHVPMIVAVYRDGLIKKVSGHVTLSHALETMEAGDIISDLSKASDNISVGNS